MGMNDQELIGKILQGNTDHYKYLVEKYQRGVFRVCLGFVHQKEDADDISQEVFVKAFMALATFKGRSAFSTWLYRIAVNTSLNFKRKSVRDIRVAENCSLEESYGHVLFSEPCPSADQIMIGKENALYVHQAINALPEKQRIAFILSKYQELPQKKISEVMKVSEGAVEQLLQRAKCNLQKRLAVFYERNYCKA